LQAAPTITAATTTRDVLIPDMIASLVRPHRNLTVAEPEKISCPALRKRAAATFDPPPMGGEVAPECLF
jgi:hypothetical protein